MTSCNSPLKPGSWFAVKLYTSGPAQHAAVLMLSRTGWAWLQKEGMDG